MRTTSSYYLVGAARAAPPHGPREPIVLKLYLQFLLLRDGPAVFFRQSSAFFGFLSARYRSEPTRPRWSIYAS